MRKLMLYVCLAPAAFTLSWAQTQTASSSSPVPAPDTPAPPQLPAPAPVAAPAASKPIKIGNVTITGSIRTRAEMWDWFEPNTGDPSYTYLGTIGRVSFSQSLEKMDWQVELAVPVLLGLPSNAVAAGTQGALGLGANYFTANNRNQNVAGIFAKQAFVRFKSATQSLKVGRFEFLDGSETAPKNATLAALKRDRINQRLLGNFGWSDVGRSFDGVHYSYNKPGGNFTFVGAVPTRGVFQTDGWGWTNTAFGYASFTKPWGEGRHTADTRVFVLQYQDWRRIVKTDDRPLAVRRNDLANIRITTYGGHSVHAFQTTAGTVDFLFWGALQTGDWGLQSHRANAAAIEAGYQPKGMKWKPWLRGGFYDGSGDKNPNDSTHTTFFQVLPTPRPFAKFPFFNMMNNRDTNAALILRPHAKVTLASEFHGMRLSSRDDLWYQGGGAFQPWTFGYAGRATSGARSLANLYDTSVEYRMRPNVTLTGYYAHAQGLAAISTIYPKGAGANFGYLEMMYKF